MPARRGQGEGSVFKRERDGKWVAQIDLGYVNGKRSRPTKTARTKALAQAALKDMIATRDAGAVPDSATVEQWLNHWLDRIVDAKVKAGQLKPSTAKGYRQHVETWLIPSMGKVRLQRLGPRHIRALHEHMREEGKADATIRNAHATLRKALRVAYTDGKLARLPFGDVTAPTPKATYPILTSAEVGKVLAAASGDPRSLARVYVALFGGLRQGEALALRWENVTDSHIRVEESLARVDGRLVRQATKTIRSRRSVPMVHALAAALDRWRQESGGTGYVFHGYRGPEYPEGAERDNRAWHAVLAAAGVPSVPLHGARGTCATILQECGVAPRVVADILGHSDVRVLFDHYSHSDDDQRRAALDLLSKAIEG